MKIRKAILDDYEIINALHENLLEKLYNLRHLNMKGPGHFGISKEKFNNWITDNDQEVFLAEENNVIIGFLNLIIRVAPENEFANSLKYVEVDNLSIEKNSQRKGVGKALMDRSEKWAKSKNINNLIVGARATNYEALDFYKKMGYEATSVWFRKEISI